MAGNLPPVPPVLKPIQHYLKTAVEHDVRDPVIAYWSRLYALQAGLKIDRKSRENLAFLTSLMDWLEEQKKEMNTNEAITSEVVAQAHIENYALKLFLWADTEDRAGRFNKNVVKAFYTSGMLFDVLTIFGELTEEVTHHRKYSKWKAAYIHNCLKNGETPIPGPANSEDSEFAEGGEGGGWGNRGEDASNETPRSDSQAGGENEFTNNFNVPSTSNYQQPDNGMGSHLQLPSGGVHAPPSTPSEMPATPTENHHPTFVETDFNPPPHPEGLQLSPQDFTRAQKYCKWAGSALQYEDAATAIDNLQKALRLLTTGRDS